jgi:hypothetical protein
MKFENISPKSLIKILLYNQAKHEYPNPLTTKSQGK